MKFICSKQNLFTAVQTVSKAVPNKTTMSILECILVDASEDFIKLTANDTELGIETVIEGEIVDKGVVAIEAKMLLDVVRKLPDSQITIETDDNFSVSITCGKSKFNIMGKSGEDFTSLPEVEKSDAVIISQMTLKDLIRQTIFSIGVSETNKIMSGIIKACEKRPVAVADMERVVNEIERGLNNLMEKEVDSTFIGELVMEKLKELDEVAYVRFASVYRQFTDVNTFIKEIEKLIGNK